MNLVARSTDVKTGDSELRVGVYVVYYERAWHEGEAAAGGGGGWAGGR